jgi:hypothetical protein
VLLCWPEKKVLKALFGSIGEYSDYHFPKYLARPSVIVSVVVTDKVASLAIDLGNFMSVDVAPLHFAKDDVTHLVVGTFLKGVFYPRVTGEAMACALAARITPVW